MTENKIRGSVLNSYIKFVKKKWGVDGVTALVKYIGANTEGFKEGNWYDQKIEYKAFDWIKKNKGEQYVTECGTFCIQQLGLLSYVVRFTDIEYILKEAKKGYKDAYNYGSLDVELGRKEAKIVLQDAAVDEYACLSWLGAFIGAMEMTKTKGDIRELKCQRKGAPRCEFKMTWQ